MLWRSDFGNSYMPPLAPMDNIRYRAELVKRTSRDLTLRSDVISMCSESCSFFFDSFLWTRDPRDRVMPDRPFVLWGFQEGELLKRFEVHLQEGTDLGILKSRDMGVTWTFTGWALWRWLFHTGFDCLLGSRKEDYVDSHSESSLFGKLRYNLNKLPVWMLPGDFDTRKGGKNVQHMMMRNDDMGTTLEGEATNPDFGRAGRYSVALIDEFATWDDAEAAWMSLGDTCDFRFCVFTPKGTANYAYELHESGRTPFVKLGWWLHPFKGADQYYDSSGKLRSPWYDLQVRRRGAQEVAQEIDMEFLGSGLPVFDITKLIDVKKRIIEDIYDNNYGAGYRLEVTGSHDPEDKIRSTPVEYDTPQDLFNKYFGVDHFGEVGVLRVWVPPESTLLEKGDYAHEFRYVMGIDTSEGLQEGDMSSIDIYDRLTQTQAAQWRGKEDPDIVADIAFFIWKMFDKPYLIPEANTFGSEVIRRLKKLLKNEALKHLHVSMTTGKRQDEKTERLGFYTSRVTKPLAISRLVRYVRDGETTINSAQTVSEMLRYERPSITSKATAAKSGWYDDTVLSMMLCLEGSDCAPAVRKIPQAKKMPVDIFELMEMQRKHSQTGNWATA